MASISSSSSATVRVEKATSEFLIGPDWALNIDICDTLNANRTLAKDVLKALKKRMQHKNPNVNILALTLLETMVKNCGDYIHVQIAERNILQEMVKIVKKKHDLRLRDKVITLIGAWHDAFGGIGGKYPQYHMAYEDLRRLGIDFPRRPPEPPELYSPPPQPVAEPIARQVQPPPPGYPMPRQYPQPGDPVAGIPQPSYGMPSTSSTRLDEAMAAEGNISLSSLNAMRDVLDLLNDMLQAVDPSDQMAVKDEVIVDLVEQCRLNQRKLIQMLGNTGDEELLGVGLDLNDCLQIALGKHDAIASGSPLPPEVTSIKTETSEKQDSSPKSAGVSTPTAMSNGNNTPSAPAVTPKKGSVDEDEEEEEDEFALLARRHSTPRANASSSTPAVQSDAASSEAPSSPANALVPISPPPPVRTKDQDILDLLSITLATPTSTEPVSQVPPPSMQNPNHIRSTSQPDPFSGQPGLGFNSYVAPWAQAQSEPQSPFQAQSQTQSPLQAQSLPQSPFQAQSLPQSPFQAQYLPQSPFQTQTASQNLSPSQPRSDAGPQPERDPQNLAEYQYTTTQEPSFRASRSQPETPPHTAYPPPPWAAAPGYLTNQGPGFRQPYTYSHERINGEAQVNSNPQFSAGNGGQKPFIPSYRLFEDLNVLGNSDGKFKSVLGSGSRSFSGSIGGRKL